MVAPSLYKVITRPYELISRAPQIAIGALGGAGPLLLRTIDSSFAGAFTAANPVTVDTSNNDGTTAISDAAAEVQTAICPNPLAVLGSLPELFCLPVKKGKDLAANIYICIAVYDLLREAQQKLLSDESIKKQSAAMKSRYQSQFSDEKALDFLLRSAGKKR